MSDGRIPVIIDCDPGHDDAVALALAFGSGKLDVKGVTTVAGNSTIENTYNNALRFLSFIGVDVEVAKGAAKPLLRALTTAPNVHGESGLDGTDLGEPWLKGSARPAVDLLADVLLTSPEPVTLIPVGPLTNIATVFLAKPDVKAKVERIVLMGGAALEGNWTPSAEFNIFVDPEAARVVFESGVPLTMVGLDVTHRALIYPDEIEALRKQGRIGRAIAELMDFYGIYYRKQFKGNPIHDAVAVAAVFCPEVLSTQHLNVSIETVGEFTLGRTVVDFRGVTGREPNCDVALGIDREAFIDLIFDAVGKLEEGGGGLVSGSLVLANANVIRADGSIQTGCDVVVRNGVIEEVLNREERDLSCSDRSVNTWEVCDCTDCFVTPGLVNLHTHSPMTILRGIAEDVNVEEWFNRKIWPFESILTEKDVYIGAMLGIYEMIDCGTTAFCDHYFFADKIASAAFESGIRADIAPTVFGMVPNWREALDEASLLIENINHKWGSLVKMRIGPHAPYTCSPSVLEACAERAVELNVGIHIHVSETEKQIKDSITQYGKTPFAILKESGVLDVPCIIGHGIWIQEEELSYLGDDAVFAVCPKTYLKLSSGFGNLYRFQWERLAKDEARRLDQGNYEVSGESSCLGRLEEPLKIGVGTDGAASSNTLNPLEQVRLYGLLAKDHLGDASAYPLKSLWQMLMNGHLALSANTGDVAPGYAADLVVWDLDMVHTWPVYDPLASILYSADARNVRHVLVEGHFKKRDGKVLVCNVEELLKESQDIRDRLLTEGPKTSELKY